MCEAGELALHPEELLGVGDGFFLGVGDVHADQVAAVFRAGGLVLAGPDPTGMGGVVAGFGDQRELELLVEAGLTPLEAIRVATYNAALFTGTEHSRGRVQPGFAADLVVVDGDPSQTIAALEQVAIVFKDGIGYDPQRFIDSVRGIVGAR